MIEIGKTYWGKTKEGRNTIRLVVNITNKDVYYECVSPTPKGLTRTGNVIKCNVNKFNSKCYLGEYKGEDVHGRVLINILDTVGNELSVCNRRKAKWWVKRGRAKWMNDDTVQMITTEVEDRLKEIHGGKSGPYIKKMCCVCGIDKNITGHHLVPIRHKGEVELGLYFAVLNVIFVCYNCHKKYEEITYKDHKWKPEETDPVKYIMAWRQRFFDIMKPKYFDEWRMSPLIVDTID